jgi:hypothetical protein
MNSPTSGLSQFSSVSKDAITSLNGRSGTFNGYSFDRAGYMAL